MHGHRCRLGTSSLWPALPTCPPSLASSALFTREYRPSACCMQRAGVVSARVSGLRGPRPCAQRPYSNPEEAPRPHPVRRGGRTGRRCWRLPRTEPTTQTPGAGARSPSRRGRLASDLSPSSRGAAEPGPRPKPRPAVGGAPHGTAGSACAQDHSPRRPLRCFRGTLCAPSPLPLGS